MNQWSDFFCFNRLLVYSPQICENYKNRSGDGVSIYFIVIWMIGDLSNFFGSYIQNLLPTMIILSVYYTLCDLILLCQIVYYQQQHPPSTINQHSHQHPHHPFLQGLVTDPAVEEAGCSSEETQALLADHRHQDQSDSSTVDRPKDHFLSTVKRTMNHLKSSLERSRLWSYVLTYCLILLIGLTSWSISQNSQSHNHQIDHPLPPEFGGDRKDEAEVWNDGAQILGWISAAAYLGSRFPQIIKNSKTRCKGLSLLFFLVGITGNLTYVLSILISKHDFVHIWINLSWLVGSGGVIFLDLIVLGQFWYYSKHPAP
ncbi:PQ loop repeat-domain-containing protein [Phakopsora pachyrhizi]|uniref:PQ loop repeat-domain-containing protein n=1 Tax=Phakopsora pachyrhizi TaxID=170000 RepID=A0AAV0AZQ1_PHAPC|nr:PQ loop repeat-domain-containing protein [Phakopsora pachyrhizi]